MAPPPLIQPKKRSKWPWIIGAIAALMVIGAGVLTIILVCILGDARNVKSGALDAYSDEGSEYQQVVLMYQAYQQQTLYRDADIENIYDRAVDLDKRCGAAVASDDYKQLKLLADRMDDIADDMRHAMVRGGYTLPASVDDD